MPDAAVLKDVPAEPGVAKPDPILVVDGVRRSYGGLVAVDVELDDQYANLTVRVVVDVENCPDTAINAQVVDLGEPLGDRRIWDRAFGNTVALDAE